MQITITLTKHDYARLEAALRRYHERSNRVYADLDLPQRSTPPSIEAFIAARLIAALEFDEAIELEWGA